jgi:hypothetical protein
MGVSIDGNRTARDEGPKCPSEMLSTFDKYRSIKFTRRVTADDIRLYARDTLCWGDLVAYVKMTKNDISIHEAELLMGLDAIFEGRDDV